MLQPAIMLRDPDLIKDILITNFNNFRNNEFQVSKKHDPLTAISPFFSKDEDWQLGRKAISPMFSQSKVSTTAFFEEIFKCIKDLFQFQLKNIMPMSNEVATGLIEFIKSFPSNTDFDAKDVSDLYSEYYVTIY